MKTRNVVIGILIFVVLVLVMIFIKNYTNSEGDNPLIGKLTTVYVATGGGKEDFLNDKNVKQILRKKYKLNVVFDTWSNGKTITKPLIRESVGLGNQEIVAGMENKKTYTINSPGVTKYDALFTSDQRFYDYYKLAPNKEKGEADRYSVGGGSLTLNTPIVIYSWKKVVDVLIKEGIVTEKETYNDCC